MIADIFIKKDASVKELIKLYDRMEAAFGGSCPSKLLCYGSVLTITIESEFYIPNHEILEAADDLDRIINDIVRRQ